MGPVAFAQRYASNRIARYHAEGMQFTTPQYSGTRRTKAGLALARGKETAADLLVINNWRGAHAYPLHAIKMMLKRRALSVDASAIVAQRQKRLQSIRAKLKRESMRLQQMQDLGGCRAIVADIAALRELQGRFDKADAKAPKREQLKRHVLHSEDDYVTTPKADGYRGIHKVYQYRTQSKHLEVFDGLLIEVQLRSRLQHMWATAVEVVDAFSDRSLKSSLRTNLGDKDWRRFFALAGSYFAKLEECPTVPGTPSDPETLATELKEIAGRKKVVDILMSLGESVKVFGDDPIENAKAYILKLDTKAREFELLSFYTYESAQKRLILEEAESVDKPEIYVVLASVDKLQSFEAAYPNYYLDTQAFVGALKPIL